MHQPTLLRNAFGSEGPNLFRKPARCEPSVSGHKVSSHGPGLYRHASPNNSLCLGDLLSDPEDGIESENRFLLSRLHCVSILPLGKV